MLRSGSGRRLLGQYEFLFLALVGAIVVRPLLKDGFVGVLLLNVLTTAILVGSAHAVSGKKRTLKLGLLLMVPAFLSSWSTAFIGRLWPMVVANILTFTFVCYVLSVMMLNILKEKNVTRDTIFGSACVYMLFGFAFADLFVVSQIIEPQSFGQAIDIAPVGSEVKLVSDLSYFSFVTLTTLGYGDLTPKTGTVQGLATLEAMLGQFYLAVLVARLVGLHLAGTKLTTE
jgi:hypothetical protein